MIISVCYALLDDTFAAWWKYGIMHENLHSNVGIRILLIVECKLQSQNTQNDHTTIYLPTDHYMSSNRALNANKNLNEYSIQLSSSVCLLKWAHFNYLELVRTQL